MSVRVEELRVSRDARGWVVEPLDAAGLAGQRNVHVVVNEPGAVRGNHRHRLSTEILTVTGPGQVRYRATDAVQEVDVPPGAVIRFTFPPGVAHAVRNTGAAPQVLVAFSTAADPSGDTEPDPLFV